ncbi:MAG: HD-GYP domain-containing protein [Thermotaleaceae bacterium]
MSQMPLKVKLYTGTVIIIGFVFLLLGVFYYDPRMNLADIIFFMVLAIITESFSVILKAETALSVMFAIGLATVLIFNPFIASIITFLGFLCRIEYVEGKGPKIFNHDIYKDLFNGSAYAVCAVASGFVYKVADGYFHFLIGRLNIMGIVLGTITYVLSNVIIYSLLDAFLQDKKFENIFKGNLWIIRNLLAISPLGIILALAHLNFGKFAVILFFVPLLLARYSFKLYMDMRHVYFETIKALSSAMEAKDQYTNGHSYRVADYAVAIAEKMGLSSNKIEKIRTAAILHDIGKIGIADSILNKVGRLEDNEYLEIQKHPEIGAKILSEVDFLGDVAHIIKHHHEQYDGKGYPDGLKGVEIPIEACILAVADAYDAMTSNRPYRRAMSHQTAANILVEQMDKQFHPIVVKAFLDHFHGKEKELIADAG